MAEKEALSPPKIVGLSNICQHHSQNDFITVPLSSDNSKILFLKGFQLILTAIASSLFWPAIAKP
jgi:hypothetical protein